MFPVDDTDGYPDGIDDLFEPHRCSIDAILGVVVVLVSHTVCNSVATYHQIEKQTYHNIL